jgi:4'-phosphopantetheinyl transferase
LPNPDQTSLATEVHLWHLELTDPGLFELLSDDEQARAARFKFDRDRDRFVACRCHLRRILSRYLNVAPGVLRFSYGPHGKPFLPGAEIRFNVSHSGDHALIAVALGREVGVDIECPDMRLNPAELTRHFLTPAEAAFVHDAPAGEQRDAFLACWTRKEAWAKAVGVGLAEQPDRFNVSASLCSQSSTLQDPITGLPWTILQLDLRPGLCGALAVEGGGAAIQKYS